ncbi:Short stature homeobox protein 2 [Coemansia sp. RSA 1250]|nr:Short stature homeobox protein 2 [Coemansia sp. RSA 1250]
MESHHSAAVYQRLAADASASNEYYYNHQYSYHPYHRGTSPQRAQESLSPQPSIPIKGKRKRASPQQLEVLNRVFASTSFPSTEMRNRLARELGMTPRTVQIWFQNKRQASRQRDGHHSRNTKSMASSAHINSFGRQYSKSQSPSNSDSIASRQSPSPSPVAPAGSRDGSSGSPQQQQQQLMVLVDAATAARPGPKCSAPSPARPAASAPAPAEYTYKHKFKLGSANLTPSGQHAEYAHTRNDQWFTEDTPARLDYLYSRKGVAQRPMSPRAERLPPVAEAAGARPPSFSMQFPPAYQIQPVNEPRRQRPLSFGYSPPSAEAVPVQRTMSLMDMLNAPPEQRRLPPLPSLAPEAAH